MAIAKPRFPAELFPNGYLKGPRNSLTAHTRTGQKVIHGHGLWLFGKAIPTTRFVIQEGRHGASGQLEAGVKKKNTTKKKKKHLSRTGDFRCKSKHTQKPG